MLGLAACNEEGKKSGVLQSQTFTIGDTQVTVLSGLKHVYNLGLDIYGGLYLPQYIEGTILKLSPTFDLLAMLCGPVGGWYEYPKQCSPMDQNKPVAGQRFYSLHTAIPDGNGNLYVAEYKAGRVRQFTIMREFIRNLGNPGDPVSLQGPVIAWPEDDGCVYVGDAKNHIIVRYKSDGTIAGWLGAGQDGRVQPGFRFDHIATIASDESGVLNNPHLVRYGTDGNLYVADTGNYRI